MTSEVNKIWENLKKKKMGNFESWIKYKMNIENDKVYHNML